MRCLLRAASARYHDDLRRVFGSCVCSSKTIARTFDGRWCLSPLVAVADRRKPHPAAPLGCVRGRPTTTSPSRL